MTIVSRASVLVLLLISCANAEDLAGESGGTGGSPGSGGAAGRGGSAVSSGGSSESAGSGSPSSPATSGGSGSVSASGGTAGSDNGGSAGATGGASGTATSSADASVTASADASIAAEASYDGPVASGLALTYAGIGDSVTFKVNIVNNGTQSPPINTLAVRYYLKTEFAPGAGDVVFDSAGWHGQVDPYYLDLRASCRATYHTFTPGTGVPPVVTPDAEVVAPSDASSATTEASTREHDASSVHDASSLRDAGTDVAQLLAAPAASNNPDAYLDLTCASTQVLAPGDTLSMQVRWQNSLSADDYSYQPGTVDAPNPHMLLLQGGIVLSGTAP